MTITKETIVDKIEVLADGQLQIREANVVIEDGKEIARTFHRRVLDPGRDQDKLASSDRRIQDIAGAVWTPEVVSARQAKLQEINAAQQAQMERVEALRQAKR